MLKCQCWLSSWLPWWSLQRYGSIVTLCECLSVSYHQYLDSLFSNLFQLTNENIQSASRLTFCDGDQEVTGGFPSIGQRCRNSFHVMTSLHIAMIWCRTWQSTWMRRLKREPRDVVMWSCDFCIAWTIEIPIHGCIDQYKRLFNLHRVHYHKHTILTIVTTVCLATHTK